MARPKLGDSETVRLHIKLTDEEMQRIDDWRFANRMPSRSEAVRRLCAMSLSADAGHAALTSPLVEEGELANEAARGEAERLAAVGEG